MRKKNLLIIAMFLTLILNFCIPVKAEVSIRLSKSTYTMYVGNTLQLKSVVKGSKSKVKWSSSNKNIASVSTSGKVTAKKAGKVTITAKVSGKKATCSINIKPNITEVSKVLDKNLSQVIKMLGYKQVKNMKQIYTKNGSLNSICSRIQASSSNSAQGKWNITIADKKLSLFGVKVGMTAEKAHSLLAKNKWTLWYNGWKSSGKSTRMYFNRGAIINIVFRNGIIHEIFYSWQLEEE